MTQINKQKSEVLKKKTDETVDKKTHLYIDGTNLFAGQNELFGPQKYLSFKYLLKEIDKLINIDQTYFYASYMNRKNRLTPILRDLIASEALFYKEVRNTAKTSFYKGHRSPVSGKEKGVDVHLAVDIVKDAFLGNCKHIAVMTGDADLIYPIEIVKLFNIS